jgi:hypothetical protein
VGQVVQSACCVAPVVSLKVPGAQFWGLVVWIGQYFATGHTAQSPVVWAPVLSLKVPAGQAVGLVVAKGQYSPVGQGRHSSTTAALRPAET